MENTGNENQESTVTRHSSMSVFVLVSGIFLLVLLGVFGWYVLKTPTIDLDRISKVVGVDTAKDFPQGTFSYTIPGVPYIGVHKHIGEIAYIFGDTSGAVVALLEYWNPGQNNFAEITNEIIKRAASGSFAFDHVKEYILSLGDYVMKQEQLDIADIKKYVNSKVKTPLLLFLPLSTNQPAEPPYYYPATVLIGIDEPEQKLIFSSYWMGNNYEVSFEEFQMLQGIRLPNERNTYFIIQPKNLKTALTEIKNLDETAYPSRGIIMNETVEMFKNYTVGIGAIFSRAYNVQEQYFELVMNDPKFSQFMPPAFKMYTFYQLAGAKLALGKDDEATNYVMRAIELNHDLDQPFKDFPGYEIRDNVPASTTDRISGPYRVLGDIYKKSNELVAAKEAYEKALAIKSNNTLALRGLYFVESRLNIETLSNIDGATFRNVLIQKSPWSVSWKLTDGSTGTYKTSFISVSGDTELSGRLFDSSRGTRSGDIRDITIQNNCVSFTFTLTGTQYDYCLTKAGLLKGALIWFERDGDIFRGEIVARPNE